MLEKGLYENIDKLSNIARGFMQARILLVANEINIFSVIGEEGRFLDDIVTHCGTDRRATEIFLNALTGMGLLLKKKDFYENSALTREHLIYGKEYYLGDSLRHSYNLYDRWADLLNVVKTGKPVKTGDEVRKSPEENKNFVLGMANIGRFSVEELLSVIDLSDKRKFLDMGGGPGTYAIAFCRRYPYLKATVFDLPKVTSIAVEQILKAGLSDRIDTVSGDYLKDPIGSAYDVILLSNVIHSLGEKDILLLFQKAREALLPEGQFIVKDFFPSDDRTGPEYPLVFAVNMLISTKEGNTYTEAEVTDWLKKSGFASVEIKRVTAYTKIAIAVKK
ncbi:MAG TPA: methyltransferase [Candidatus Eremiobacteraeota bacterium]|nr:MAG: Demethylspheroidene O-methyltransferase [bacterium ADurb.Bin363]HPZ08104.1 methyltransferase [Candidatus Eremiobacteraeota bacterium]